jgi:hypothetical protein
MSARRASDSRLLSIIRLTQLKADLTVNHNMTLVNGLIRNEEAIVSVLMDNIKVTQLMDCAEFLLYILETITPESARNHIAIRTMVKHPSFYLTDSFYDVLPMLFCAEHGYTSILKTLLKHTLVDPSHDESEALTLACKHGHLETVELLLRDPRVDPTAKDYRAIRCAMLSGATSVVQRLWEDPAVHLTMPIAMKIQLETFLSKVSSLRI